MKLNVLFLKLIDKYRLPEARTVPMSHSLLLVEASVRKAHVQIVSETCDSGWKGTV